MQGASSVTSLTSATSQADLSQPTVEEPIKPEDEPAEEGPEFEYGKYVLSLFARNFYNFKFMALLLAFCINIVLLFFKVTQLDDVDGVADDVNEAIANATMGGEEEE